MAMALTSCFDDGDDDGDGDSDDDDDENDDDDDDGYHRQVQLPSQHDVFSFYLVSVQIRHQIKYSASSASDFCLLFNSFE